MDYMCPLSRLTLSLHASKPPMRQFEFLCGVPCVASVSREQALRVSNTRKCGHEQKQLKKCRASFAVERLPYRPVVLTG